MTMAVYAGTFDPITNGHLDIAVRAARFLTNSSSVFTTTPQGNASFSLQKRE